MKIRVRPRSRWSSRSRFEHLCLDRDVQGGDGLVGDDHLRLQGQRPRDADALPLTAGELVRVAVVVLRVQADGVHQPLDRGLAFGLGLLDAVDDEGVGDDRADRLARVQRRVRVLEDHLHLATQGLQLRALDRRDLAAVEVDRARRRVHQAQQQAGGRGLAATRLAHEAERLAAHDVERDAVDGLDGADLPAEEPGVDREVLVEVADLHQRLAGSGEVGGGLAGGDAHTAFSSIDVVPGFVGLDALLELAPELAARLGREQAGDLVVGAPCTGSSTGSVCLCASRTYGQRGWKEHPPGRLISDGGRPEIGTSSSPRGESSRGIDDSRPQV